MILFPRKTNLIRNLLPLLVLFILPTRILSQESEEIVETSLFLNIPQIGNLEIPALIVSQKAYLPVTQIFSFLKIKYTPTPTMDSIYGYISDPENAFTIDRNNRTIRYQGKETRVDPGDLYLTESYLYMNSDIFESVFGLEFQFNFRSLSLTLKTQVELPVIRLLRQERMRANIARLEGEKEVDTTIGKQYPLFHFGMADWSLLSTQIVNGPSAYHGTLSLGSILFGGETDITLRYNSNQPFTEKQQYYLWHYVNDDFKYIRQAKAGKISPEKTSSIFAPIIGAELTNVPTTFRRSFCSFTVSDYTEPGWIVELYVNYVLIQYTQADASGFYLFEVPLVYGNTSVTLRFYGPYGEERLLEKSILIPINFIPPGELEYTVSGGMVEDGKNSIFARGNIRYGLGKRITIGAGTEYLSSLAANNYMPFLNLALRIGPRLLVTGEYTYGVQFKGYLSYMHKSNLRIEANYLRYHNNQQAVATFMQEERKISVSMPFQRKKLGLFFRFTYDQIILPSTRSINLEFLISGNIYGISTNLTTFALFPKYFQSTVYSNLSLGFRFPKGFILRPQVQYEYTRSQFTTVKLELEKNLWAHGSVNISYEANPVSHNHILQIGFRYNLPFAQTGASARIGNKYVSFDEYAHGSLMVDPKTHFASFGYRTSVGRGGITILPFLDLNHNKKKDENEPRAYGIDILSASNRIKQDNHDSTIHILDLEPYTNYYIEIDPGSFVNIAWQIESPRISVYVEPNQFTLVEVPISIMGEASGFVYQEDILHEQGIGRIVVQVFSSDSALVGETLTEPDGYFSFMSLHPGSYYAKLKTSQMERLGYHVIPEEIPFVINPSSEGDVIDNLAFFIQK